MTIIGEWGSAVGGRIAGCNEAATLMAVSVVRRINLTQNLLTDTIKRLIALGLATTGGSWLPATHWILNNYHVPYRDYPGDSWRTVLSDANANGQVVIMQVDRAGSGFPEDRGVNGHAVTVFAQTANGWIVGDPNTREAQQGQTVVYSDSQIAAAHPVALTVPTSQMTGQLPTAIASPVAQPSATADPCAGVGDTPVIGAVMGWICQQQQRVEGSVWWVWLTQPIRIVKLVGGLILIGIAAFIFIAPQLERAAAVAAAPETGGMSLAASQRLGAYNRSRRQRRTLVQAP